MWDWRQQREGRLSTIRRVLREEQKKEREKKERLMDRGDERVKGKQVRSRGKANAAMTKAAALGLMYRGSIQRLPKKVWRGENERPPEWKFEVMTKGIAGMDTNRQYKVTIKRVCKCTCKEYEAMLVRKGPFVWCKHICTQLCRRC
jgi:hypothetical protein